MTDAGLDDLVAGIARTPHLLVAVDFDGTLAPIVPDPADARPLPESAAALARLAALPATTVLVVSGRALDVLSSLAGLPPEVVLVGSHGAEHASGEVADLDADALARRTALKHELRALVGDVAGVRLEDKTTGVAVHVRQASREDAARVLDAVRTGPASAPGIRSLPGHEVLELSVVDIGKGAAVEALRARTGATAVLAAGDDVTDEDLFAVLRPGDLGIKIGPGPTAAAHRLPDPESLAALLTALASARTP